ncbi:MAG: divergent polysaccharide deacetylase family protein [Paracoccaceae bacterium]
MGVIGVNRGFVTGVIWGGVVAVTGLAVVSQVAPLPQPGPMAGETAGAEATDGSNTSDQAAGVEAVAAPEAIAGGGSGEAPAAPVAEALADVAESPESSTTDAEAAAVPETGEETGELAGEVAGEVAPADEMAVEELQPEILQKGPPPGSGQPVEADGVTEADVPGDAAAPEPVTETETGTEPGPELAQPELPMATAPEAPVAPAQPEAGTTLPAPADAAAPDLAQAIAPAEPMPDAAPDAVLSPPAQPGEALMQPAAQGLAEAAPALVVPEEPQPAPMALPQILPEAAAEGGALPEADAIAMPGVRTDRLPRIGDEESPPVAEAAPGAAVGEEVAVLGTTPLELFRRAFDNPDGKPIFGIVLVDDGLPEDERARLAALPFPVTFALDPLAADAAAAARVYRDAGQEVAMLASGIPQGATAADLEQTFQALDIALPEAVAVLDRMTGGFQDDLALARQAVPIVAEQGRGIVTYDRGLNSADQVARREGAPRATIFRILDSEGESIPKMRNYLDRAAFKAAQEGRVLVIGQARAETVAAILEWTVEGRAASVALAPLSAVLETSATP